jgi:predicted AAA+ superfamily ATPase
MDSEKILQFYRMWQSLLPQRVDGYIYDEEMKLLPTRYIFSKAKKYIEKLLTNQLIETEKIVLMPGIRGIGKSTLLAQAFAIEKYLKTKKDRLLLENIGKLDKRLYLDVGQLHAEQISLNDFFKYYEEIEGFHFEKPNKKLLILLDEVHFDENWSLFLKNIFDRSKGNNDILIIATGSSALQINMISDLKRRIEVWDIYPMKFTEYMILKYNNYPIPHLSDNLQNILFNSSNAKEVFNGLNANELQIDKYFAHKVPIGLEENFFQSGGFPSAFKIENEIRAIEIIKTVIDGIIVKDILTLKSFEKNTSSKINDLLYLLAQSDVISYHKLQESLRIPRQETLESLIEVLIIAGILVKIPAYSQTYGSARKTPKFLFITPSLRSALLNNYFLSGIEGKKLEDYFALIYHKDIKGNKFFGNTKLSYDAAERDADFILTLNNIKNIVIEVGFNKEETKQVENTMKKVNSIYGLIIGSKNLELVNDKIVKIPLKFLLTI